MRHFLGFVLFLIFSNGAFSQYNSFSLYQYDNKIINPAFVGMNNQQSYSTLFRIDDYENFGNSSDVVISYENQFSNINSGIGLLIESHKMGPGATVLLKLLYDYQIKLMDKKMINVGVGVNYLRNAVDFSMYRPVIIDDPIFNSGPEQYRNIDIDFGLSYVSNKFSGGISLKNALKSKLRESQFGSDVVDNSQFLNLFAAYKFDLSRILKLKPSAYVQTDYESYILEFNLSSEWYDFLIGGVSFQPIGSYSHFAINAGISWKDKIQCYGIIYDDYAKKTNVNNLKKYEFALRVNIANE